MQLSLESSKSLSLTLELYSRLPPPSYKWSDGRPLLHILWVTVWLPVLLFGRFSEVE